MIDKVKITRKNYWLIVVMLFVVFFWFANLLWLSMGMVLITGYYKSMLFVLKLIKPQIIKQLLKVAFIFLTLVLSIIGVRMFMYDLFRIPSISMENTLYQRDIIVVNKMAYGPKLPQSPYEIPWVKIYYYLKDNSKKAISKNWWSHTRLSGAGAIKRGDILVFNSRTNFFLVKRCVGLPGDNLLIKDGEILINKSHYKFSKTIKNEYHLKISDRRDFNRQLDSSGLKDNVWVEKDSLNQLTITLDFNEYECLKKFSSIKLLKPKIDSYSLNEKLFAKPLDMFWTLDNMGPILIPGKGTKIELNSYTTILYKKILEKFEGVKLTESEKKYYIDGIPAYTYPFKKDYLFFMGDNRKHSMDSRIIGFVPKTQVVGKVQCVLLSNYRDEFRWDRIIRSL